MKQNEKLIGTWKTTYEDFDNLRCTFELKSENDQILGYVTDIIEKSGRSHKDNSKVLEVQSFDKSMGRAKYEMEYDGNKYEVDTSLTLVGDQLILNYDCCGYAVKEVWNRIN